MLALQAIAASSGGSLAGSVVDDTGAAVGRARVLVSYSLPPKVVRPPAPPVATGGLAATAVADARGLFSIPALPPGEYVACAEAPGPGFLDPCHWATSAPVFGVVDGNATTGIRITLARGAVVPVHVTDAQAMLKPVSGDTDFALQVHVVTAKGVHHNVPISASNGAGRDHMATVPFDTPVTLQVLSPQLKVNDASGKAVAPGGIGVTVASGTTSAGIGLTVAGRK